MGNRKLYEIKDWEIIFCMRQVSFLIFLVLIFSGCVSQMSPTDKIGGEILTQFAREMRAKGFYPIGSGGGEKNGKMSLVMISFKVEEVLDIETGRCLIVDSVNRLSTIIDSNEKYRAYFEPFPIDIEILCIVFIGKEPTSENLSEVQYVSLSEGTVVYQIDKNHPSAHLYPAPPYHPLRTVREETFEEARKIASAGCVTSW